MLSNKKGFLLIESLLLLEIVVVLSFVLANTIVVFVNGVKTEFYNTDKEEELMKNAYE